MLKIRLRRMGAKQDPFYRVVVSDSRKTPRGPFIEVIGHYAPGSTSGSLRVDVERADAWLRKGAHASETVKRLLVRARAAGA